MMALACWVTAARTTSLMCAQTQETQTETEAATATETATETEGQGEVKDEGQGHASVQEAQEEGEVAAGVAGVAYGSVVGGRDTYMRERHIRHSLHALEHT